MEASDMNVERRFIGAPEIEVRAVEGDEPPVIAGYAAVFEQLSEDLGGFREKIAPGAFAKSLGGDVRALFNHDSNLILGRSKSGTLKLAEDSRGLRVEFTPPNTATARHVIEAIRRGDVDQMSFGFNTLADTWSEDRDGKIVRTLNEVRLFDVSVVTFPAYPQTDAAVRSMQAWKGETSAASANANAHFRSTDIMRRRLGLLT